MNEYVMIVEAYIVTRAPSFWSVFLSIFLIVFVLVELGVEEIIKLGVGEIIKWVKNQRYSVTT